MHGVIVCPRCGRAKGVRASQKTTSCQCGFVIAVHASKLKARVENVKDLPEAVRTIAAAGRLGAPSRRKPSRDISTRVAEVAAKAGDRRHRILAAAETLTAELVLFTAEDFDRVLRLLNLPEADACLAILRRENLLAEPRPGYFRVISG